MKREVSTFNTGSFNSWEEVFRNPKQISVITLDTGKSYLPKSVVFQDGAKDETIGLPVLAYLVEHKDKGSFLIDAGLDSSYQQNPLGNIKGLLAKSIAPKNDQKKGMDVQSQLKNKGVAIKGVFFTHFHMDHISGALDLQKGIEYYCGMGEKYQNYPLLLHGDFFKDVNKLNVVDFSGTAVMPPFGPCADILGDGSIWAVYTPGHTKGHISYLINGPEPILVTGDACLNSIEFSQEKVLNSFCSDRQTAQESLNKIIAFKKQYPQVKLLYGHETSN